MLRRSYFFAILIAFVISFIPITQASAAPILNVDAEVGVDNHIKSYTPLPLNITVTNSGTAFSGDLVIDTPATYNAGSALVYPLELAEGESKTIQLYLDGLADDFVYMSQQPQFFYFYEGGIESGKEIDYSGDKLVRPSVYDLDTTIIYTLTDNSDRLSSFLQLKQFATFNVEVFHLNSIENFNFPTNSKGLKLANILAIDEMGISHLTEEQQKAIFNWVQEGGTLLVGGSDQVESSVSQFKDYLPLTLSNERTTITSQSLETLSKGGVFTENIVIYQAEATNNSLSTIEADGKIIAATASLGNGQIIQTAFSLGDNPLASMSGYSKLMATILQLDSNQPFRGYPTFAGNYMDYLPYEVGGVNELFPSFEVSVTTLIIIVLIYILLIGPILYLILKKFDKREHAWWIIPAISIALSIALFIVGAKDRLFQSHIQQTAYYQVTEDNNLSGYYIESILTNRGGDFTFDLDKGTTAIATRTYNGSNSTNKLHEKSYVEHHAEGSSIHLNNLNYWSVQSFIGETNIPNAGSIKTDLSLKNNLLEGTITNEFPFELKDVAIWSGHIEVALGDIAAGATINVSEQLKSALLLAPSNTNYNYNYPQSKDEILPMRLEKAKYGAAGLTEKNGLPVIIGWTDQALVGVQHNGNASVSPVSYIAQPFNANVELSGEITLGSDILNKSIDMISQTGFADLMNESTNQWYLEDGQYTYIVEIPENVKTQGDWNEISFTNKENKLTVSILNVQTNEYEPISNQKESYENYYLSEDGRVIFQIEFLNGDRGTPVILPEVEIKGVAKE
ncbi:hypothetical protein [Ureibacillus acetophenoni]|uniref:Uncharacterized protein n=1 Tax=Ureibacillus acetophenoni TaxID=614649 RepID=A0A285UU76_9BACL|nr:hypothetical protein [Ureibacillus acetophenoni]SOC44938.1 hypothetical protein SAMN05877842_12514 [Ureibacillus acetophenoni]